MSIKKAITSRRSVRKFKDTKPDWRDIIECIDSARFAPMAGGNHTIKFILVSDPEKIQKISIATQQEFVSNAQYIVVACSNPTRTENLYKEKGKTYTRQQAGAAIQNFLLSITAKRLATCWVGHFVEDEIKNALNIPEKIQVEAIFPIGYERTKPKTRKAKIDLDQILYFNEYGNKQMKKHKKFDS